MDIPLKSYTLVSLYNSTKEILTYLKYLNNDQQITEYLKDLSVYIGRKNAYFIQEKNSFIGFLVVASTREPMEKELFFALDQDHRGKHIMSKVLKELIPYLFLNENISKLIITPMNPLSASIAIENNFKTQDNFHYYIENENLKNKM